MAAFGTLTLLIALVVATYAGTASMFNGLRRSMTTLLRERFRQSTERYGTCRV